MLVTYLETSFFPQQNQQINIKRKKTQFLKAHASTSQKIQLVTHFSISEFFPLRTQFELHLCSLTLLFLKHRYQWLYFSVLWLSYFILLIADQMITYIQNSSPMFRNSLKQPNIHEEFHVTHFTISLILSTYAEIYGAEAVLYWSFRLVAVQYYA